MIQFAEKHQQSELMDLYNRCFPGDESFCACFFNTLWQPHSTLIYTENDKPCSMLHMLPLQMKSGDDTLDCVYFFALATDAQMRGKGIMGALIKHAFALCRTKNIAAVTLLVQNESLFDFYTKHGFQKSFFISQNSCRAQKLPPAFSIRPMTAADCHAVNAIYTAAVQGTLHGVRSESFFENLLCAYAQTCYVLIDHAESIQAYCVGGAAEKMQYRATECMGQKAEMLMAALAAENNLPQAFWSSAPTGENRFAQGCVCVLNGQKISLHDTFLNLMYN